MLLATGSRFTNIQAEGIPNHITIPGHQGYIEN
jgi:hypothetical protein